MFRSARILCALAVWGLASCGGVVEEDEPDEVDAEDESFLAGGKADAAGVREGTAEAFAILRLATDAAETTLAATKDVGLGKKTAAAIVKARVGPDGAARTADDRRFLRLEALDAVPQVGPLAFGRLLAYARTKGLITKAQAVCGTGRSAGDLSRLPAAVRVATLRLRAGSSRLEVYSTDDVPDRTVESFRLRTCLALEFDLGALGLDASASSLAKPWRVVLLPHATYDAATDAAGTDGIAFMKERGSDDAFVVPTDALANPVELDDTIAHELDHLIAGRLAPNDGELPWYVLEGAAVHLGAIYTHAVHAQISDWVRSHAVRATEADAELVWRRYGLEDGTKDIDEVEHDQAISGFFAEFLRTRGGVVALPAKLFEVERAVSGGASLASAFQAKVGLSLSRAQADFEASLRATAGREAERFRGTIYE